MVTAQVQSSISLTFITDPSGVALTGSGSNVATLNFGSVSQFISPPLKVTETIGVIKFHSEHAIRYLRRQVERH